VIVHTNNQLEIPDAVPTPDSAALMNKHKQNPSAFKSSAKRLAKMNVESTINRVVVHMSRSQFVKADLIFNEATEWLPQLAQTLALRALPSNDVTGGFLGFVSKLFFFFFNRSFLKRSNQTTT